MQSGVRPPIQMQPNPNGLRNSAGTFNPQVQVNGPGSGNPIGNGINNLSGGRSSAPPTVNSGAAVLGGKGAAPPPVAGAAPAGAFFGASTLLKGGIALGLAALWIGLFPPPVTSGLTPGGLGLRGALGSPFTQKSTGTNVTLPDPTCGATSGFWFWYEYFPDSTRSYWIWVPFTFQGTPVGFSGFTNNNSEIGKVTITHGSVTTSNYVILTTGDAYGRWAATDFRTCFGQSGPSSQPNNSPPPPPGLQDDYQSRSLGKAQSSSAANGQASANSTGWAGNQAASQGSNSSSFFPPPNTQQAAPPGTAHTGYGAGASTSTGNQTSSSSQPNSSALNPPPSTLAGGNSFLPPPPPAIKQLQNTPTPNSSSTNTNQTPNSPPPNPSPSCSPCQDALLKQQQQSNEKLNNLERLLNASSSAVDLALLPQINSNVNTINTKLGAQLPNGGIGGYLQKIQTFAETAWNNTRFQKILALLTFITVLHNAWMLSSQLGQTLMMIIDNGLQTIGLKLKDENGNDIAASQFFSTGIQDMIKAVIGDDNYTSISGQLAKANRIYQASANVLSSLMSIQSSILGMCDLIGSYVGRIGNALRKDGVVRESAYYKMPETITSGNRILTLIEQANATVEPIAQVTSDVLNITQTSQQITQDLNQLRTNAQQAQGEITKPPLTDAQRQKLEEQNANNVSKTQDVGAL